MTEEIPLVISLNKNINYESLISKLENISSKNQNQINNNGNDNDNTGYMLHILSFGKIFLKKHETTIKYLFYVDLIWMIASVVTFYINKYSNVAICIFIFGSFMNLLSCYILFNYYFDKKYKMYVGHCITISCSFIMNMLFIIIYIDMVGKQTIINELNNYNIITKIFLYAHLVHNLLFAYICYLIFFVICLIGAFLLLQIILAIVLNLHK